MPTPPTAIAGRGSGRLAALVYDSLKERLIDGHYPAGSRLSVESLRDEFAVSKQPVMEALRLLSGDGLVEILPQVGCTVMDYSLEEVADFFRMFAGSEAAIAAAAAARRSADQLLGLETASMQIEQTLGSLDESTRVHRYRLLNRAFHGEIHAMAGSRIMSMVGQRLWDLSDFLIYTIGAGTPLGGATEQRHEDHEIVREAIAAGDSVAAYAAMESHILSTIDLMQR